MCPIRPHLRHSAFRNGHAARIWVVEPHPAHRCPWRPSGRDSDWWEFPFPQLLVLARRGWRSFSTASTSGWWSFSAASTSGVGPWVGPLTIAPLVANATYELAIFKTISRVGEDSLRHALRTSLCGVLRTIISRMSRARTSDAPKLQSRPMQRRSATQSPKVWPGFILHW